MLVLFFALLAGNLRRKNLGEGEFFKSDIFQHLRRALKSELWLPRTDRRECQSSLPESTRRSSERYNYCNYARYDLAPDNSKPELSSANLSNHSPKSPPKADESPPKCLIAASTSMMTVGRLFSTEPKWERLFSFVLVNFYPK